MARRRGIPRQPAQDPAARASIEALTQLVEELMGMRGSELDRSLTLRDLAALGLIDLQGVLPNGVPVDGRTVTASESVSGDRTPPSAPTGLAASAALTVVLLQWDSGPATVAHTEVWRSQTNDLGTADKVGSSVAPVYADPIGATAGVYYYWIRHVSTGGVAGAFNGTAGTAATLAQITTTHIGDNAITTPKIIAGAITAESAILADLAVVNAKIANLAVTEAKIGDLAVTEAKIDDLAVGTAKIGDAAVETLKIAGQAVTLPSSAYSASSLSVGTSAVDILTLTVTTTGAPVLIIGSSNVRPNSPGGGTWRYRIMRDAVQVFDGGLQGWTRNADGATDTLATIAVVDTPSAGTYTYKLQAWISSGTQTMEERSLTTLELKR